MSISAVVDWLNSKQTNGIILILSGLIGIVFFTFAASFTYFRLYADLERDEAQYRMIGKMGLSRPELRKIVTRQLLLMFFLPILVAVIHRRTGNGQRFGLPIEQYLEGLFTIMSLPSSKAQNRNLYTIV